MSVATCDEGQGRRCERVHARQGIPSVSMAREAMAREAMRKAIKEAIRRCTLDIEE